MVSETDPYLWASLASFFLGLALGQGATYVLRGRESAAVSARRRPRRLARATSFLALSILAGVGLLVFRDKTGPLIVGAPALYAFVAWTLIVAAFAFLAALRPLVLGAPLAIVCAAALFFLGYCLQGWQSLSPGTEPALEIARLLPYEVGPDSFRGQLEAARVGAGAGEGSREVRLASSSVGLIAESIELRGPLGFMAGLARGSPPSAGSVLRVYRLAGLVAPGGAALSFAPPPRQRLLDAILPPPTDQTRSELLGLVLRHRIASPAADLVALQPIGFCLASDGATLSVR